MNATHDESQAAPFLNELREGASSQDGRRRFRRYTWRVRLRVELEERTAEGVRFRQCDVMTEDIGRGGFAFIHTQLVHPGTKVRAKLTLLPHQPTVVGEVRNCTHLEGQKHRVGVEFAEKLEDAPA